jgi:6-phosphofructokinase 1
VDVQIKDLFPARLDCRAFDEEIITMRVALLTGGGDCPGLNAVIYAAVKKGINHYGDEFIGFLNGWRGVLDNNWVPLTLESTD